MAEVDEAKVAGMSGAQRRAVRDALVAAYPSRGRLEELLDILDRPLARYAAEYMSLPDAVFKVVEGARAEGWLPQLLAEAAAVNPGNRQLAGVVSQFRRATLGAGSGGRPGGGSLPAARGDTGAATSASMLPRLAQPPSDRQVIGVLANEIFDLTEARRLVSAAGLSPGRQPAWNVSNAELFWWQVHSLFVGGAVIGGWPNVLREAHHARPANAVIAAAAAAAGVTDLPPAGSDSAAGPTTDGSPGASAGAIQTGEAAEIAVGTSDGQITGPPAGKQHAPATDGPNSAQEGNNGWDFFVSYTQVDARWAEWIAWTLEEVGYRVLLQAWDMPGGSNWVVGMQNGVHQAGRTIAVLSAAYGRSVYGAAEWQAAWARDPDGADRKLLVFRIENCDRPGLLGQIVSRDLFGIPQDEARTTLLQAAKLAVGGGRAKPTTGPFFPGSSRTPPFPPAG